MPDWQPIETAPKDGTRIRAKDAQGRRRVTFWGKTCHVPIYGWNWGRDPENVDLWHPTHWQPIGEPDAR